MPNFFLWLKQTIDKGKPLPHINSYTRIQAAAPHGVGVFAIRDIPKGINIFLGERIRVSVVNKSAVENLAPGIKRLYQDFCVLEGGRYLGPDNFNNMTIGWYVNHSEDNPNVRYVHNRFISLREIKEGEEILVDYRTYNAPSEVPSA